MTDYAPFDDARPDLAPVETCWSLPESLLELASNDSELISDLISVFRSDTETRMLKIDEALRAGSFSDLAAQAHTIKGSARQLGAHTLADASQTLEGMAKAQDRELVASYVICLRQELAKTLARMACFLEERSARCAVPQ